MGKLTKNSRGGFTLVELLIVVIILGILAAIVIPQFTNASDDARKSSLTSQLQTLRAQVELYKLQHRDLYPTADGTAAGAWKWEKLTGKTTELGVAGSGNLGPYIQEEIVNPLRTSTTPASGVAYSSTDVSGGSSFAFGTGNGWVITGSGKIFASSKGGAYVYDESDPSAANNAN